MTGFPHLDLEANERLEWVDFDPITGDYRAYHLQSASTGDGGFHLNFDLHRQAPGLQPCLLQVLSVTCPKSDIADSEALLLDVRGAATLKEDRLQLASRLNRIIAALRQKKRPDAGDLLPLLSEAARELWLKPLSNLEVA